MVEQVTLNHRVGGSIPSQPTHFFVYPVGHFGFAPVTFLVSFPLTQVIVIFLRTGEATADGLAAGSGLIELSLLVVLWLGVLLPAYTNASFTSELLKLASPCVATQRTSQVFVHPAPLLELCAPM